MRPQSHKKRAHPSARLTDEASRTPSSNLFTLSRGILKDRPGHTRPVGEPGTHLATTRSLEWRRRLRTLFVIGSSRSMLEKSGSANDSVERTRDRAPWPIQRRDAKGELEDGQNDRPAMSGTFKKPPSGSLVEYTFLSRVLVRPRSFSDSACRTSVSSYVRATQGQEVAYRLYAWLAHAVSCCFIFVRRRYRLAFMRIYSRS